MQPRVSHPKQPAQGCLQWLWMAQMIAEPEVLDVLAEAPAPAPQFDRIEIFDYAVASTLEED
jgi:hypothetical protein